MKHLILVPGHAIVRDVHKLHNDDGWFLKPFQSGEGPCYVEHVCYGVRLATEHPEALLVFSGARTDIRAPYSEAAGYLMIAEHYGWNALQRTALEERALDSFQNLQYAIELAGAPEVIDVAGWAFKEERFRFHAATLGVPAGKFRYHGVNNPPDLEDALRHEAETLRLFRSDPTGSSGRLAQKRIERDVSARKCS